MRLTVEVEGSGVFELPGDGSELAAFVSFAAMRGFGAEHPLIALAERLQKTAGIAMGPLTTFYEATIEDAEDREKLELAWQEAPDLAAAATGAAGFLRDDAIAATLLNRAGTPGLAEQLAAIGGIASDAGAGRVRLSYTL